MNQILPEHGLAGRPRVSALRVLGTLVVGTIALGFVSGGWCLKALYRTRADLFRRTEEVRTGMTRAEVEEVFAGYLMDEPRFGMISVAPSEVFEGWSGPKATCAVFSNPARTRFQGFEHAVVRFDGVGRVSASGAYTDP